MTAASLVTVPGIGGQRQGDGCQARVFVISGYYLGWHVGEMEQCLQRLTVCWDIATVGETCAHADDIGVAQIQWQVAPSSNNQPLKALKTAC